MEKNKIVNFTSSTTSGVGVGMNISRPNSSPSRLYMSGKNIGKAACIDQPTPRKIVCGDEPEYAKTARKVEVPEDSFVEEVFYVKDPKRPGMDFRLGDTCVIMRAAATGRYYLVTFPKFFTQNSDLGFEFKYDNNQMRKLIKGHGIKGGTVFGTSSRISSQDEWMPGREAWVAPMSDHDCEEDAIKISDTFAAQVGVAFQHHYEKSWDDDEYILLNLYGTEEEHIGFPQCGQPVREDGILFGLRPRNKNNALVGLTKKGLMIPDEPYDMLFYAEPGAIVSEVKVETERYKDKTNNRAANKPTYRHTILLEEYESSYNDFYNSIIRWYRRKEKEDVNIKELISEELFNFVLTALGNMTVDHSLRNDGSYNLVKRQFKKIQQHDWRLVIKVNEKTPARVRHKMTGLHGDKSTIGRIVPRADMPIDDYGNVADIVTSPLPFLRRQIFSALMELDINFINVQIYPELKRNIDEQNYDKAWEILSTFFETASPEFNENVQALSADQRMEYLALISKDPNEFSLMLDETENSIEVIRRLSEKYAHIKPTKVRYVNVQGDMIETLMSVPITSEYFLMLDKFGDDISSQSTPRFNLFGLPSSLSKEDRPKNFYRAKVNRNVGQTESRILVNQYGGEYAVTQVTLGNSPDANNRAVERIIRSDDPFNIDRLVYPGEERSNAAINYIRSILSDTGIILRDETEEDRTK